MYTPVVLCVFACVVARPPGPTPAPSDVPRIAGPEPLSRNEIALRTNVQLPERPLQKVYPNDYILPRFLLPRYLRFEENERLVPVTVPDYLDKEIDFIRHLSDPNTEPYDIDYPRWIMQNPYLQTEKQPLSIEIQGLDSSVKGEKNVPLKVKIELDKESAEDRDVKNSRSRFAFTPLESGFYLEDQMSSRQATMATASPETNLATVPPRKLRQNPNLSRTKSLVASDLDRLRMGITQGGTTDGTGISEQMHVLEATVDPADSIYGVAMLAAVGAAVTMGILAFAFGWYQLSKKAKAAADVDYPAYGVTGPTPDSSGDRKLAHSAHMYHYQHQKQQIIAMERNGMEQRNGSVSDPESEDDNEEGDYTVYECPGFATTGDMEVKNPLFSEDPTPATPGKCEMVKPQPKN